jgi:hypothetical protein
MPSSATVCGSFPTNVITTRQHETKRLQQPTEALAIGVEGRRLHQNAAAPLTQPLPILLSLVR